MFRLLVFVALMSGVLMAAGCGSKPDGPTQSVQMRGPHGEAPGDTKTASK